MKPCSGLTFLLVAVSSVTSQIIRDSFNPQRGARPENLPGENVTSQDSNSRQRTQQEVLFLLRRVNERLGSIETAALQQTRKLDTFDYRMTKLESLAQENKDTLKSEFDHFQRKQEANEWELNKISTLLEVLRQDTATLQQNVIETKVTLKSKKLNIDDEESGDDEKGAVSNTRIQALGATLYSIRNVVGAIQTSLELLVKNSTEAIDTIRKINNATVNLITKQQLYFALEDMKTTWVPEMPILSLGSTYFSSDKATELPGDCQDIQSLGNDQSGIYQIQPRTSRTPFFVFCDMDYKEGGWTVIQNRVDGGTDFYREWRDYKHGFGNVGNEFWMGLQKVYMLTHQKVYTLCILLKDFEGDTSEACYQGFAIGSESEGYSLQVLGTYEGEAGDSLLYHAGYKFSTKDVDNDDWEDGNCATDHFGGWWYKGCDTSNLNGRYMNGPLPRSMEYQGIYWYDWHGPLYSLMSTRMMIRPTGLNVTVQANIKAANQTKAPLQ